MLPTTVIAESPTKLSPENTKNEDNESLANLSSESFYLYFGTYESKERANKIEDSPTLHARSFSSLIKCEAAGKKIYDKIFKPIKFFDGRWVCVEK